MRTGGLTLAAVLLIGGLLRMTGSPLDSPAQAQDVQRTTTSAKSITKTAYPDEIRATIQSFCGAPADLTAETTPSELKNHWNVPEKGRSAIRYVIAVLPDPAHTHLALFFDRSIDSLVQAAQKKGYVFDRAILPWDRAAGAEASDPDAREAQAAKRAAREAYPGLLIFRSERGPRTDDPNAATESSACSERSSGRPAVLFVFIVGETPTGGLRKEQFRNARKIIQDIGKDSPGAATSAKNPMLILGPTFSGSLDSLHQEVTEAAPEFHETYIYSGTVSSARSIVQFELGAPSTVQFASFQENDDYALAQFARFARYRGYQRNKIAVLSEDATTYGAQRVLRPQADFEDAPLDGAKTPVDSDDAIQLHFPREISYFRSAYQKETASQPSSASSTPSVATLPPDLSEGGNDDDAVPPFAGVQTSRTQESVMLGIVSELQKHHIEFTVLLATDPVDELFLARYLRHTYPQGRVVIISPDLLFFREQDPSLVGILGLNTYSLVPGLNDRLCSQKEISGVHEDRLFVSSSSVGTFNAMVGLLSLDDAIAAGWNPGPRRESSNRGSRFVPQAPYVEYGTPLVQDSSDETGCQKKPLLWITMLSRDGFWPLVGIGEREFRSADHQEPVAQFRRDHEVPSTLKVVSGDVTLPERKPATMPGAWSMAYCLCLILLVVHTFLSWNGTILADSEVRAQFARNRDVRATIVMVLGALALGTIFIVLMATRMPIVSWTGGTALTFFMWLPFPLFVGLSLWDIAELRGQPPVALAFGILLLAFLGFQLYLASYPSEYLRTYWSVRLPHITSGVSPILPVLLLFAAGYWWMWMSLRGISLVDLRRPRLPDKKDFCNFQHRITDCEGEELRETAHPFFFVWQVLLPVAVLALLFLTVVDLKHPVQTIEGWAYDWGFSLLLALMIATLLGSLLKLVNTWLKCRQILSGLDRTPLRYAFSRMKNLSWHSFWNPGGSTLRETYKIMSRALENLGRLERVLQADTDCPLTPEHRAAITAQLGETDNAKIAMHEAYMKTFADKEGTANQSGGSPAAAPDISTSAARFLGSNILRWSARKEKEATLLKDLTEKFEALQKSMAKTAAVLVCNLLLPWWPQEPTPVVSEDARLDAPKISLTRTLAEEFVALVYVNFLVTVLLRMRTLVICAGGLYVFIVLATAVYPFEPHPALQSLTVVLLLVGGVAVGFVYAEMHREAILSRLTSTPVGELGVDFWLKLASAGAIPLFSLLAAQFPGINQFLFSWLEPALQAVK